MPNGKLGFLENVSDERPCDKFGVFGSVTPKPTVFVFRAFLKLLCVSDMGKRRACTVRFDLFLRDCRVRSTTSRVSGTAWSLQDTRAIFGKRISVYMITTKYIYIYIYIFKKKYFQMLM
jgi:hypothetical protein